MIIFRLPHGETLGCSLQQAGLKWWDLGEDYPYDEIRESEISNLYSKCECEILNPQTQKKEMWFLTALQNFYPYPFMEEGTKYRELTYYLSSEEPVSDTDFP